MIEQVHPSRAAPELILIRHAQSNFNKGFLSYRSLNNLEHLSWYQCVQIDNFNKEVAYAKQYIDCGITPEGVEQCQKAREILKDEEVEVVLVSPHQRALETCHEIFRGRDIRVEVHPLLAEVFRFSCDVCGHIEQKMKAFPQFDFSFMKDYSELWFIQILSDHLKRKCDSHLPKESQMSYKEKQEKLLELLQSRVIYESPQQLRMRMWKVKEMLDQYRKKYKKIAVVTHFQVLQSLLAKSYNEIGETTQIQMFPNATPFKRWIDDLLAVR